MSRFAVSRLLRDAVVVVAPAVQRRMPEPFSVSGSVASRSRDLLAVALTVFSLTSQAADSTPVVATGQAAPDSHSGLSLTLTWASDYLFRGISLSDKLPVVQGSLDFDTAPVWGVTGHIGLWYSKVRIDTTDPATPAGAQSVLQSKREQGVYYGLTGNLVAGIRWSAQIENYTYPDFRELNHDEYRLALSRKFNDLHLSPTVEVSHTRFNTVYPGGDGRYLEINLDLKPAAHWSLIGHLGRSRYADQMLGDQDYVDRSLILSREIDAYKLQFAASSTNTRQFGRMGDSTLFMRISRSF